MTETTDPLVEEGLRSIASGERIVGGYAIPVYNLNDGRRVLSERGFLAVIGVKGRGTSNGHRLKKILSDRVLRALFSKNVLMAIEEPIRFKSERNLLTFGYDAEILKGFCVGFVRAREMGALKTDVQRRYAEYCQTLLIAFADLGIKAWIDEATGYQKVRERDALHRILDTYINSHWARWSKTFPDEFYQQIYRLKGHPFDPDKVARPGFIGKLTSDIVYSRLAPGVLDELERKNPVVEEKGYRQRKHHQWLTEDHGHPKLREHIGNLIFMMRGASHWDSFYRNLQRAAPKLHETAEFDFGEA
ncbi:hypothetical protein NBRC116590_03030 [Pelagimonas sp. KU-00592-HH]|uniref:P63C domain-containing protein n=1 Tax=Pelagimonas sp. KU-00592-HH TaxID=3127651 RepID=UPI003109D58A